MAKKVNLAKISASAKKSVSGKSYAKGGSLKEIELPGCNLYLKGFAFDSNGNKVVKLTFPNGPAFSLQTNKGEDLYVTNRQSIKGNLSEISEADIATIAKEVSAYVKKYGSNTQKSKLKIYKGNFAEGGKSSGPQTKEEKAFYAYKDTLSVKYGNGFKNSELTESEFDKLYDLKTKMNGSTSKENFLKNVVSNERSQGKYEDGGQPLGSTKVYAKGGAAEGGYDDPDAARDVELFAENNPSLYTQRMIPIIKNLSRKKKKGTFDVVKAALLMKYYVEDADKRYQKEMNNNSNPRGFFLSVNDRKVLAKELAEQFSEQYDNGEYDHFEEGGQPLGSTKLYAEGGIPESRINDVLHAYKTAALWSSSDEDEESLLGKYDLSDIADPTSRKMRDNVVKFLTENENDIKESGLDDDQLGHSLWLTQNHHGAGFFDFTMDDDVEKRLTAAAHGLKEMDLYVGDDGKIWGGGSQTYSEGGEPLGSTKLYLRGGTPAQQGYHKFGALFPSEQDKFIEKYNSIKGTSLSFKDIDKDSNNDFYAWYGANYEDGGQAEGGHIFSVRVKSVYNEFVDKFKDKPGFIDTLLVNGAMEPVFVYKLENPQDRKEAFDFLKDKHVYSMEITPEMLFGVFVPPYYQKVFSDGGQPLGSTRLYEDGGQPLGSTKLYARGGEAVEKIANGEAGAYVENRIPFKGSNLEGKTLDNGDYVVLSYGYYPLWYFNMENREWFGNADKYSVSTSKQMSQSRPGWEVPLIPMAELHEKMKNDDAKKYELGGVMVGVLQPMRIDNTLAVSDTSANTHM